MKLNNKIKTVSVITFALMLIFAISACTTTPTGKVIEPVSQPEQPVKIGLAAALSGYAAFCGEPELDGAKLALEEINANGGISGMPVELVVEDTASDSSKTVSAVLKLITVNDVDVIVGPTWAGTFQAALPLGDEYHKIIMTPSDSITAMKSEVNYQNSYSVWYSSEQEMSILIDYFKAKNYKTVVFIIQVDPFWEDMYTQFEKLAKDQGIETEVIYFNGGEQSFQTKILKIKSLQPDIVFFGPNSGFEMGAFLKQKTEIAPELTIISSESISGYLGTFDSELEGVKYITPQEPSQEFIEKYIQKYGKNPVFSAAHAYDAVYILAEALEHTDGSDVQIREYLKNRVFSSAAFGTIEFSDIGGVKDTKNFEVRQINNGESATIWKRE